MELSLELDRLYSNFREPNIEHKYFPFATLKKVLNQRDEDKLQIGESFLGQPIYKISVGKGSKSILIWSQMHGNESTGTRAMFDVLNFLKTEHKHAKDILNNLTLVFIPMLNPDGANLYTRRNAIGIDINRDFVQNASPEIRILKSQVSHNNYEFLFNLHDQRTIFNARGTKEPATLSFLAPSGNLEKTVTQKRKEVMGIISKMNNNLQMLIADKIGRYSDDFYPTATGDNFTRQEERCILFEAGHFPNDYQRNITRKYNALAILLGLYGIISKSTYSEGYESYFKIPENDKNFYDYIIRNVKIVHGNNESVIDLGIQFKDILKENRLEIEARFVEIGDLSAKLGHQEIDAENKIYKSKLCEFPKLDELVNFSLENLNINQSFFHNLVGGFD